MPIEATHSRLIDSRRSRHGKRGIQKCLSHACSEVGRKHHPQYDSDHPARPRVSTNLNPEDQAHEKEHNEQQILPCQIPDRGAHSPQNEIAQGWQQQQQQAPVHSVPASQEINCKQDANAQHKRNNWNLPVPIEPLPQQRSQRKGYPKKQGCSKKQPVAPGGTVHLLHISHRLNTRIARTLAG